MTPEISTAVMIERVREMAADSADSQDHVLLTQVANRIELLLAAESGMSREMACIRHALDIPLDQSVQSGVVDAFVRLNAEILGLSQCREAAEKPVGTVLSAGRQMSAHNKDLVVDVLVESGELAPGDKLFTAPPLPVVPDEKPESTDKFLSAYISQQPYYSEAVNIGWNLCRAAMLQLSGNSEQVTPTISFYRDGIVAAAQWVEKKREAYDSEHGRHDPDTGTFEFGNDAQLEYSETLRDIEEGIRALHPKAGSNSPVIPEGWVFVPVTADSEMMAAAIACGVTRGTDGALYVKYDDIYAAMIAAAPQLERKDGDV
ncbi:hypothetical protein AACK17_00560 [Pectobacterium punjabense]|uniref:hypothetical protein n=1 Tax=Pectobacterium punjabense TaxID=2108399 RepID=UPI00311D6FF4